MFENTAAVSYFLLEFNIETWQKDVGVRSLDNVVHPGACLSCCLFVCTYLSLMYTNIVLLYF